MDFNIKQNCITLKSLNPHPSIILFLVIEESSLIASFQQDKHASKHSNLRHFLRTKFLLSLRHRIKNIHYFK